MALKRLSAPGARGWGGALELDIIAALTHHRVEVYTADAGAHAPACNEYCLGCARIVLAFVWSLADVL